MTKPAEISVSEGREGRLSDRAFDGLAVLLAFLAYFIVFLANQLELEIGRAAISSLSNLLPLIVVSLVARGIITRHLLQAPLRRRVLGHVALAAAFALLWYWLLMILIGVRSRGSFTDFVVRTFFDPPALSWQLLQGLTLYALVAALTHMRAQQALPSFIVTAPPEPSAGAKESALSRYFIRQGEEIFPVDVSQIVSITGADDYAEVATLSGSHLVRMTLAEFEAALESGRFIRVHRSRIVNADRITKAEPAGGGRMLLHMENGEMIQASRTGSKLLRDRVI